MDLNFRVYKKKLESKKLNIFQTYPFSFWSREENFELKKSLKKKLLKIGVRLEALIDS